ncbi:MAG: DUF1559 domain-containing protein [Gemmataceae bacterium]
MEVVAVGVLVVAVSGLVVVGLQHYWETSARLRCTNNLKLVGDGIQTYHQQNDNYPPSHIAPGYASWAVVLVPMLPTTERELLNKWDLSKPYVQQPKQPRQAVLSIYFCPTRKRPSLVSVEGDGENAKQTHVPGGLGDYGVCMGDGSLEKLWATDSANGAIIPAKVLERKDDRILKWKSRTAQNDLVRGQSNTLLVGEKHLVHEETCKASTGDGSLYNGDNPSSYARVAGSSHELAASRLDPFRNNFGSYHGNQVCLFLKADGSIHPFTPSVSPLLLAQLAKRGK